MRMSLSTAPRNTALWIGKVLLLACVAIPSTLLAQNWTQQTPATRPTARDSSAMVYDSLHHEIVLFGGADTTGPLNETWVYDGTTWTHLHPMNSPPARLWAGMAFDAAHGQVVLFGGCPTGGPTLTYLNDTWLWDGVNWTNATSSGGPSGRQAPAMAYDPDFGVVLFGGSDTVPGALSDTWFWNGTSWSGAELSMNPTARRFASMSFDSVNDELVLFGGDDGTNTKSDTWTYNLSGWFQPSPAHSPSARSGQGQAWDDVRNLTVLFGGGNPDDTWTWNGTDWTHETTIASPPARYYVNMAYDVRHSDMVLFGGLTASFSGDLQDTWTLGYTYSESWMLVTGPGFQSTVVGPSARSYAAATGEYSDVLVFGGTDGTSVFNDTWFWFGNQWAVMGSGTSPPARQSSAMAYNPINGISVMFGGNSAVGELTLLSDTWNWNGSWTQVSPASHPTARYGHAMTYDRAHSLAVLFGGFTSASSVGNGETWLWDGADWNQVTPTPAPTGRANHSMVFDGARNQVVLFGGITNGVYLNETWVWNGTNWTQMSPAHSPPARASFSMVYDSVHGTVQIFGGRNSGGALHDTWVWDGVDWTQVTPTTSPTGRYGMASAYLAPAGQFFLYGGNNGSSNLQEGWAFASPYVPTVIMPAAFYGQSYSYTIVPAGGVAPYTFTATGNPSSFASVGFSLDPSTGAVTNSSVSLSPDQTIGFGVNIQDAQGQSTLLSFQMKTDSAIVFSPSPLPDATMGANYSVQLSASGGTPPFTYQATGLPAGLNLSVDTIVGQCTASSTNVTLSAIDNYGVTVSVGPLSLNCNPKPLIANTSPLPNGQVNTYYSVQLNTNAVYDPPGVAPYTWSVPPSSLPAGLSLSSTGLISGTPTTIGGPTTFTVTFTDRWGATTNQPFQITIQPPSLTITTTQLPLGTLHVTYPAASIAATGGTPAYHFSATGLPTGLTISPTTGAITGIPTVAGAFTPTFTVTDQATGNVQQQIPITVAAAGTNSEDWIQLAPATPPNGRESAAMFYDSVHHQTILFGGWCCTGEGLFNDTNAWNGTDWVALSPATDPGALSSAAAAFDVAHGQGVVFGGINGSYTTVNDTWLWDGSTWAHASPAHSPTARSGAVMAWDGHQIVLFGGTANGTDEFNETWTWNGSDWTQITSAVSGTPPTGRQNAAMAFDSAHGKVVLFGGLNNTLEADLHDTWLWDGAALTWTQASPATNPAARYGHGMAYDSLRGQTIVFGGISYETSTYFADTWAWNGSAWTQLNPPHNPGARSAAAMVFDVAHSQVLLFGGYLGSSASDVGDTWVLQGPYVSNLTLPAATQNSAYSATIPVTGGTTPYIFGTPASLPPGITFNTATGAFGGTPTAAGPYNITVDIQDAEGLSIAPQLTLTVNPAPTQLVLQPTTLPDATAGTNYLEQLSASGGVPAYVFSVSGLPTGLHINSGNQIVGQCTAGSNSTNVMLGVTDSATPTHNSASVGPLTVNCNAAPSIATTSPLANGIVNTAYSATLLASGGTAPLIWSLSPGNTLPAGFNLSATGVLTGTATAPTSSQFSTTVSDFWGANATKSFNVTFYPVLIVTSTSLPAGAQGVAYPSGTTLAVTGGTGSSTYHFSATGFPNGLQIDPASGAITGTPTQFGTFQPTFTVTDQTPQTATKQISLNVSASGTLTLSPTTLPDATAGFNYLEQLSAAGGVSPYVFSATGLPAGLHFNGSNQIAGQCTAGSTNVMLGVTDSAQPVHQASVGPLTVHCNATPSITTTSPLANGIVNTAYSATLQTSGGAAPFTWSLTPGTLPAGFALNPSTGVLTGTATSAVSPQFSATATDLWGANATKSFTVTFYPVLTIASTSLPAGAQGAAYPGGTTLAVTGGTGSGTYHFSATGFPNGLQIDSASGAITGTPTQSGTFQPTFTVTDQTPQTATKQISLNVASVSALVLSPAGLPNATAGTNYAVQLSAVGGVPPYAFSATGLPAGLHLNGSNQIVGQCTAGSTNVMLGVTDSVQPVHQASVGPLTLQCNAAPSITTTSPLTSGIVNTAYSATLQMSGGTAPITWSLTPGTLPAGFALNSSTGVLTGAAASAVSAQFSATVTDRWGANATKAFTLNFNPAVTITTASLPNGTAGTAYPSGVAIAATGGSGTYAFSAAGLPPGFSIDPSSGVISGTTSQTGLFTPTFTVTGQNTQTVSTQINLTILGAPSIRILSPQLLPGGSSGHLYSQQLLWTGGVAPFTVTGTGLPNWLSLNSSTGILTGTPSSGGAFRFSITVTDSQTPTANTASQTETVVIDAPSITTTSPLPAATIGISYAQNLAASAATSPYTWTSANLPSWLTLSGAGALSGTPPVNTPASVSFDVTVTDSLGAFTTGSLTLPVLATPGLMFVTSSPLPPATANAPNSTVVQAIGGNAVLTFSAAGLPAWLTLNSATGALSGTPPSAGPVTFQITVSDTVNQSLSQNFTLPVNAVLTIGNTSPLPPATAGVAYAETMTASGGSGSYTWSATGLPSWLALSPGGVFSGTPTQAGPVSFEITVHDTANHSLTQAFTLRVDSVLEIDTASPLTAATLSFPYLATFAASGGGGGGYQWSATGLPGGFTLTSAGVLSGTPQTAGAMGFSVTVTDSRSNSVTQSFTLPVNAAVTINQSSPLPAAVVLIPYSTNFTASGGNPGYTWSATGLPSWLTLTAAGYLSGTAPAGATAVSFQVTVTDSASHSATAAFTLPVNASLAITTAALPPATLNVPYATTLAATGGSGVYAWSATGLPPWLTLSIGGTLSGTPPQALPAPFLVTVTDSYASTSSRSFTLLVATGVPLSFVTQSLSPCVANTSCSNQILATGGAPPYVFSLGPNANLGGLTLSANGLIGGAPTTVGQIAIPVVLTDQQNSISQTFTQTVYAGLTVTDTSLPSGRVGVNYGAALLGSGGQPPYAWSLYSGSLPPGLNLDPQGGNVYGTPTSAGTYTFSVQVSDSLQTSPPRQMSIVIAPPLAPLTVASPSQLPPGTVGTPYSQSLLAAGGSGQYAWTLTGGLLPAGLTLAATGAITGTPTTAQTANFNAQVSDTLGNSVTAGFSLIVTGPGSVQLLTSNPLPNGAVGVPYNYGIQVAGGTPPYYWSITQGQVPPGLTFDATNGTFNGTPTQRGTFGIVVTVTDSGGTSGSGQAASVTAKASTTRSSVTSSYTILIAGTGDFQITTGESLPNGTLGQSYSVTLAASGGSAPYRWQLVNGALPAGLVLDTGGQITGTPAAAGATSLVIRVVDSTGATATGAFMLLIVNPNVPAINVSPLPPPGTVGVAYGAGFTGVGGHAPYTWSLAGGALPPGLSLDAQGGIVSGTPTQRGNFPFTLQVTDSHRVSATQAFTIRVNSATLQVTPATIPNATTNVPYSFALSVSGGTAPYTWSLGAGGLLPGFSIDPSSGVIGGTPVNPGSFDFTISVVDSNFGMALQTYQLTVQANGITIVTTATPAATAGSPYSFGFLVANAAPPLTWAVTSGTLPPGIQLASSSGQLTGTPTTAGSYPFTVRVTDATTATTQASFTLLVNPQPLTIVSTTLPSGGAGTAYSQTIQTAGGQAPIVWTVASGTLPAGLSLASSTGTIAGTPTVVGNFAFTVQATDSTGATFQQNFNLNIGGPPPAPATTLSGLPATSNPGDQPTVTITLANGYPLPIQVTATLSITPNPGNSTDLMFSNGLRTTQITIPANTTQVTLGFQTGTLPGTIQLALTLNAASVDITPAVQPVATTKIAAAAPVIHSVAVATTSTGLQITIIGTSTTLDMKTAAFHFTAAAGATLQTTDISVDVSSLFTAWYQNPASLATGSQFTLTVPFTVGGNTSTIASVTVTLTNSVGASAPVSANVP